MSYILFEVNETLKIDFWVGKWHITCSDIPELIYKNYWYDFLVSFLFIGKKTFYMEIDKLN